MRLTNHLNLPAPGRSQTLYIHLTCLQSPVFLLNSRYRHLSATQLGFGSKSLHHVRPTFFRSYGGNLQSSLTRVLSSALGFSPRPPESVCGTDTSQAPRGDFLGSMGSRTSGLAATPSPLGVNGLTFLSYETRLRAWTTTTVRWLRYPSPSPLASTPTGWYRNINLSSIIYAFRPRLRFRLTLGGLTFPRKPWAYGERVSHSFCRYSYRHQL